MSKRQRGHSPGLNRLGHKTNPTMTQTAPRRLSHRLEIAATSLRSQEALIVTDDKLDPLRPDSIDENRVETFWRKLSHWPQPSYQHFS
jgi:hypothetical protein